MGVRAKHGRCFVRLPARRLAYPARLANKRLIAVSLFAPNAVDKFLRLVASNQPFLF
jgi:hypothetical protein